MLSLQIPKSPLEIVVETWLECLTVKNSPEKLIYVDQFFFKISWDLSSSGSTSRTRQVLTYFEQSLSVLSGQHFQQQHFNFPNFKSHLAKSNQNSGLNLNRMLWPSWKLCFKNNVITFSLGKIYWFLTGLFGKMASTPMMV